MKVTRCGAGRLLSTGISTRFCRQAHGRAFPANQYDRADSIVLVRHSESLGNVDSAAYVNTADWRIPLTELGHHQAKEAGRRLLESSSEDKKFFFYCSPYLRTKQTLKGMLSAFPDHTRVIGIREEPRISEQQFGNFQDVPAVQKAKMERHKFGRFFYRFPNGEAGMDVYSRVTSFISTVFRDSAQFRAQGVDMKNLNIVIVTHGLTLRLFLMRWMQYSVTEFEQSSNPSNAMLVRLSRQQNDDGLQWYELDEHSREALVLPEYRSPLCTSESALEDWF